MSSTALTDYLTAERIAFLSVRERYEAITALLDRLSHVAPSVPREEVRRRVFDREEAMSSRISAGIAVPHAVMEGLSETNVVLGISREGVIWDPHGRDPVHLIVLVVGGPDQHLEVLGAIAGQLRDEELYGKLLQAQDGDHAYRLLVADRGEPARRLVFNDTDVSVLTVDQARQMAERLNAARIVLHADAIDEVEYLAGLARKVGAIVVTTRPERFSGTAYGDLEIISLPLGAARRSANVKFALLYLLSQGALSRQDVVVNVFGLPGSGYLDSIRLTHIESEFDLPIGVGENEMPGDVQPHVMTRLLELVSTLATEGREGKPVGTMFVLGDYENVKGHAHQLIVNPFAGCPEDQRNVLDPNLEETIKEYAKIDGAFVVRGDGVIVSAGTFVQGGTAGSVERAGAGEGHESGLGARHAAALGLSNVTNALVIVLSESTRRASVFRRSRRLVVF
ncbi:MAG: PTS sugar transporter subunit IIA [Spirochaetota bacterium]